MKFFKPLFCFLLIFIALSDASAQMRQIHAEYSDPENEIKDISFFSSSEGFVAFRKWIGYTTDTGRTYIQRSIRIDNVDMNGYPVNLTFGFSISSIKAFDRNNIVVAGDYGTVPSILTSSDGGNNFKISFHSQYGQISLKGGIAAMVFPQGNTGYAVDIDRVLKTTDGGQSWAPVFIRPGSYFTGVEAAGNQNIVVFSNEYGLAHLFKTTDGGSNWAEVTLPPVPDKKILYSYFRSANRGWLSLADNDNHYYFYQTTNGGADWVQQNDTEASPFGALKFQFVSDSVGYALGGLFTIFKTADSGKIWEPLPRDNDFSYLFHGHNVIRFLNTDQFWAGGGSGFLELTKNGGGKPIPVAYFKADTTGVAANGTVQLKNFSRRKYSSKWYVNGSLVSTTYNASYLHNDNIGRDTIMLVVSNGTASDTSVKYYDFNTPLEIISFAPATAATGTVVTIRGSSFYDVTSVSFGGVPATEFWSTGSDVIMARVGAGASGAIRVYTQTRAGSIPGFVYIPTPVISTFSPVRATTGTTVTINGNHFDNVSAVKFGGTDAISFTVVSPTQIEAVAPSGASGNVNVITPGGTAVMTGYRAIPVINSFTPEQGTEGTVMTITGTSLTDIDSVTIGTVSPKSFTINSSEKITVIVGKGATGSVMVAKKNEAVFKTGFSWYRAPVITGFSPLSGPVGTTVTITGKNFDAVASRNVVYFGDVKAVVSSATSTQLVVAVPKGAAYQPISVLSNRLIGYSAKPFVVTFANGGSITENTFSDTIKLLTGEKYNNFKIISSDLDGDGKTDLILSRYNREGIIYSGITVYRNSGENGSISFDSPVTIYSEYDEMKVADFDNDGLVDILVAGLESASILRNTSVPGNISFVPFKLSATPVGIEIFDADSDGKTDIYYGGSYYGGDYIVRNISEPGSLAFDTPVKLFAQGAGPISYADFDGDNKPEIIRAGEILKNKSTIGSIAFEVAGNWHANEIGPKAVADIDNDGKLDIISFHRQRSYIYIARNNSGGNSISFEEPVAFQCSELPATVKIADLDGDGLVEVVAGTANNSTAVFKNTSTPGTIALAEKKDYQQGTYGGSRDQLVADLNNDGKYEIISLSELNGWITIHKNQVKPEPMILSFTPSVGDEGTTVTITGINFTGTTSVKFGGVEAGSFTVNNSTTITAKPSGGATGDIIVTNGFGADNVHGFIFGFPPSVHQLTPLTAKVGEVITISGEHFSTVAAENIVFFGTIRAQVQSATSTSLKVVVPPTPENSLVSVTVNGRTGYSGRNFSAVFPGSSALITSANFEPRIDRASTGPGVLIDLDADGKPDLLARSPQNSNIFNIARNNSDAGKISFGDNIGFDAGGAIAHRGLSGGDFDGDGLFDVVVSTVSGSSLSIFKNQSSGGNINLSKNWSYSSSTYYGGPPPTISDLDLDGKPDLATISYNDRSVSVFRNESNSAGIRMAERIGYTTQGYINDLKVADLDGDGKPELVVASDGVVIFRNNSTPGKIEFSAEQLIPGGNWPFSLDIGDLDGDGKPDIAMVNINSDDVSLYRNVSSPGTIEFQQKEKLNTGKTPTSVCIGDVDGDGKAEITVQSIDASVSSTHKNVSTLNEFAFLPPLVIKQTGGGNIVSVNDIDADGLPDIAVFGPGSSASFVRNRTGISIPARYCNNGDVKIESETSGTIYQWQIISGGNFEDLSDAGNYSGSKARTLVIKNVPSTWNGQQYRCVVDGKEDKIYILDSLGTVSTPSVKLMASDSAVCKGAPVQLYLTSAYGGVQPKYEWFVNDAPVGNPATAYEIASLNENAQIKVRLISDLACATEDTVFSSVLLIRALDSIVPVVSVIASVQEICAGTEVVFTATANGGGTAPVYQWYRNGLPVTGNGSTLSTTYISDKDSFSVELTSNAACLIEKSVFSNVVPITVKPQLQPAILIQASQTVVVLGQSAALWADITEGGSSPVYQWQDSTDTQGWKDIPGATGGTLNYLATETGNKVRCVLTSSADCAWPAVVFSNPIAFEVKDPGKKVQVMPNPAQATLNLVVDPKDHWETVEIIDMQGKPQLPVSYISNQVRVTVNVTQLKAGVYIAVLRNSTGKQERAKFMKY